MRASPALLAILLAAAACSSDSGNTPGPDAFTGITDCNDGEDDDGDGLADLEDPGCSDVTDDSELDNPTPRCSDGEDNDGDGLIDYPADPGCFNAQQDSETDDCPDGPTCPQCADGIDNDEDTRTDYPADTGCMAASDHQEATADPAACTVPYELLPSNGLVVGQLAGGSGTIASPDCGGGGTEKVFEIYVAEPRVLVASTDRTGTAVDTVVYVRDTCTEDASEVACNDNASANVAGSTVIAPIDTGYHYIVVDGQNTGSVGNFTLDVQLYPGIGTACDPELDDPCAPGLVCRTLPGASEPTCELPVCSDERDDDGDGKIDFPLDPGCTDAGDATEDDTCPATGCPQCADTVDNDMDGQADYPLDIGCASASQAVEGCGMETDPIGTITTQVSMVNTTGAANNSAPPTTPSTCSFGSGGPEKVMMISFPVALQSLRVDTSLTTVDTVVYVDQASCDGTTSTWCDDDGATTGFGSDVTIPNVPAGAYAIFVDSYSTFAVGNVSLRVTGTVQPGAACTDPMFAAGLLACPTSSPCNGSICAPPQCSDGDDDDADGLMDYPNDPGCDTPLDPSEADTCGTGACPQCGDDADNDGDGPIDFPADVQCVAASDPSEGCEADVTQPLIMPITTGTTTGAAMDFTAECASLTANSPDKTFLLTLPAQATTLTIDTVGSSFDTVLSLKTAACTTDDLYCDDQGGGSGGSSRFVATNVAAGQYVIVVDGYNGTHGNFALNVHGIVAAGGACNSPLFSAGVLACPAGQTCNGTVCQ